MKTSFYIILFFCFSHHYIHSQKSSKAYDLIHQNDKISDSTKEIHLNALLKLHFKNKSIDTFLYDSYNLMRWYNKKEQLDKAIKLNKRNIFLMDSINYQDKAFYRKNFYSLGYCLFNNNQQKEAVKYYHEVLRFDVNDKYTVRSFYSIGMYWRVNNNYFLAAEYFENAIRISKEINYIDGVTNASAASAVCYRIINTKESIKKAINILNDAIAGEKNNYDEETTYLEGYLSGLATLHRHLGTTYADKKEREFDKAIYNFQEALKYAHKYKDSSRLADIYHDIGNLYGYSNHPKTIQYFDKALTYKPDTIVKYHLYDNKSTYYTRLKEFEKAKTNIQKALKLLTPTISDDYNILTSKEEILTSKEKFSTLTSIIHKSEIYLEEAKDNPNNTKLNQTALQILENADYLLDVVRLESTEFQTKLFWRNLSSKIYTNATQACFALGDPNQAFYFMEKNKALLLLEDVLLEGQKNKAYIPQDITKTQERLKQEILKYTQSSDSVLQNRLIAKANYNTFLDTLDSKYALYFKSLRPAEIKELTLFQNNIKTNDEAYLEYIIGETNGYGLLITKDDKQLFEIQQTDTLRKQVSVLKTLMHSPIQNKEDKLKYNKLAYSVYKTLIPEHVQSLLNQKKLTIIPDNFLWEIPFEALQTSTDDNAFMLYKHSINYANSLTFLSQNSQIRRHNENMAVGFAPVNFKDNFSDLLYSKKELEQLKYFDDPELFFNSDSTKRNLKNNLQGYKIIHISTHAGIDMYNEPFLALNDSVISLNELYTTKNSAELVVLSACETGKGELYNGEGVMSLSRGFFNTGAKSVMSTLWSIEDKSTSKIMELFYKNLNKGYTKSEALHYAKLDYLENHSLSESSPYYWASIVLIGDSGTIEGLNSPNYLIYFVIAFGVLAIFFLFFFKKTKKIG
jgi:CHAT domain-containing protein/tetratricopeptide (TPR) repeat protein